MGTESNLFNKKTLQNQEFKSQINFELDSLYFTDRGQPKARNTNFLTYSKYIIRDYWNITKRWLANLVAKPIDLRNSDGYDQNKLLREQFIRAEFKTKMVNILRKLYLLGFEGKLTAHADELVHQEELKSASFFPYFGPRIPNEQKRVSSKNHLKEYPNFKESLKITAPEQLWIADITLLTTKEGEKYFHIITDAYSRKVMGYSISEKLSVVSAMKALKMALGNRKYYGDLVHHSKRGIHYCMHQYKQLLVENNIQISSSGF